MAASGLQTYRLGETDRGGGFEGTKGILLSLTGRLFSFSWKAIVGSRNRALFPGGCTRLDFKDFSIPLKLT